MVTDLPPTVADVAWDGLRPAIEAGSKDSKRGGWHHPAGTRQTKLTDPARATRVWLAMAVATRWVVSVGGQTAATLPASMLTELPGWPELWRQATTRSRPRLLRCFRRGVLRIVTTLIAQDTVPMGCFVPAPWPKSVDSSQHAPVIQRMAA